MVNIVKQARERAETTRILSKHKIYTVLDIAGYIVNTNRNKGIRMRRNRLDMFLYFVQIQSMIHTGEPIFTSTILVRDHNWPYTEWVDNYFGKKYKILSVPKFTIYWDTYKGISNLGKKLFNPHITMYDRELLDDIINELNAKSNHELRDEIATHGLTHVAVQHRDMEITERMMIDFCRNLNKEE